MTCSDCKFWKKHSGDANGDCVQMDNVAVFAAVDDRFKLVMPPDFGCRQWAPK